MIKVEFEYDGYNSRRYSRPWGALVKLKGARLEYDFTAGNYLGDSRGGAVVIECEIGDVVATGQRDGRGGNTKNELYIVKENGELENTDRKGAYDHLNDHLNEQGKDDVNPLKDFTDEELLAEIKRRGLLNE